MTASAELADLLRTRHNSDGPTIPSTDVAESVATLLSEIRQTAPARTHGGGDEPALDWATGEMDNAPVSMAISGPAYADNPIWYVNDAFEALTGYAEPEVIGENLRLLQGPETAADAVADLREAVDIWEATVVELDNYHADGSRFRNRVALAPIPDATGTISNWVGIQEERPLDS
ncbi:PAS domain-containing protein [Halonotius terrestris]|uniref:PAS domain-containing protein n=1 Tax=Halonotius terrestris TaxID=2487750 RepID=A0A8J8PD10_9EURY|nr:PAS domain-containing protein [Halonotius terrestris]TQQ82947.1 PAS domain-containing protein [Halonotius terrestris]